MTLLFLYSWCVLVFLSKLVELLRLFVVIIIAMTQEDRVSSYYCARYHAKMRTK